MELKGNHTERSNRDTENERNPEKEKSESSPMSARVQIKHLYLDM